MFDTILIILGIISILLGIFAKIGNQTSQRNIVNLKHTETDKISDILTTYDSVKFSVGLGNFSMLSELYGQVSAEQTLIAPLSKQPCVYYQSRIYRLIGETRYKEKVFEKEGFSDFYLEDETGQLLIQHKNLKDRLPALAQNILDNFHREFDAIELPTAHNNEAIVGYQLEEKLIPVGQHLYVYGEATDRNQQLMLARPLDDQHTMLISNLSKAEYLDDLQDEVKVVNYGLPILTLIGVALIVYALAF